MFSFDIPENTAVLSCCCIFKERKPILYALHDEDNDWQFLCGGDHQEADTIVVSIKEVFNHDSSTAPLSMLPVGMYVERMTKDGE
jgi:hypothetical protein